MMNEVTPTSRHRHRHSPPGSPDSDLEIIEHMFEDGLRSARSDDAEGWCPVKVTRVAYSAGVNAGKWDQLVEQAARLCRVRANQEAAKVVVWRAIARHTTDTAERKRLYTALKAGTWTRDASRQMRQHWRRGRNRTHNQIVVRSDRYRVFGLSEGGDVWLAVPGLQRREMVHIPLNTIVSPTGTLRLILREGRVEVHYQIDATTLPSSARPCGMREIGVDKGY